MTETQMRSKVRLMRRCGMFFSTMIAACAVHANCAPVIAAYAKAEATGRYALFDVASIAAAPSGEPFQVTIGGVSYTNFGKGYKRAGGGAGFEGAQLKEQERKGKSRCEPLGERKIGGVQAVGFRIRDNDKGSQPDPTAIEMWINRSTGLPIFHGMGSDDGGWRWVYGSAVSAPPASKILK